MLVVGLAILGSTVSCLAVASPKTPEPLIVVPPCPAEELMAAVRAELASAGHDVLLTLGELLEEEGFSRPGSTGRWRPKPPKGVYLEIDAHNALVWRDGDGPQWTVYHIGTGLPSEGEQRARPPLGLPRSRFVHLFVGDGHYAHHPVHTGRPESFRLLLGLGERQLALVRWPEGEWDHITQPVSN